MQERLGWDEIRKKYPDQWVVLVNVDADEDTDEVRGGVVFDHGRSRRDVYARVKKALAGRSRAVMYTGEAGKGHFLF